MKEMIFKASRGAVAIFLVIILVPMMTISCLFVDMSRVKLAKALVDSAGDLTLNSALTQYDSLLQEYYGLFATSQDIDETLANMDEYFIKCIKSAGLSDDDAQLFSKKLIGSLSSGSDENIADLLNIIVDPADFNMVRTPGGSITNPTLLKSQIVNFMKYRAPINGGLSILSSLKSFSNLSKETELIDKRQAYYEAEKDVNTRCQKAWNAINEYNKLDCSTDTSYYSKLQNSFTTNNGGSDANNFKKRYQSIIDDAYQYIYISNNKDTGDKLSFENKIIKGSYVEPTKYESGQSGSGMRYDWYYYESNNNNCYLNNKLRANYSNKKYSVTKYDSDSRIVVNTTSQADLEAAVKSAVQSLNNLNKQASAVTNNLDKSQLYNTRYVYYCVEKSSAYQDAAKDFANKMQTLEHRYKWVADANLTDGYTTIEGNCTDALGVKFTTADLSKSFTAEGRTKTLKNWYSDLRKAFLQGSLAQYYKFASELSEEAKEASRTYYEKLNSVNKSLESVSNEIKAYKKVLRKASGFLSDASTHLKKISEEVSSGGALSNAKDAWSSSANEIGDSSSIAAQDRAEIQNIAKQFKPEDINKLKQRIDNIKSNIDKLIKEIDNFKFGNKKLEDITKYSQLKNQIHGIATNSENNFNPQYGGADQKPCTKSSLGYQSSIVLEKGFHVGSIDVKWVKQADSNPYLKQDILSFYIYLYKNFNKSGDYNKISDSNNNDLKDKNEDLENNEESATDKISKEGDNEKNTVSERNSNFSQTDISGQSGLPSKDPIQSLTGGNTNQYAGGAESKSMSDSDSSAAASNASSSTSALFKNIGNWLSQMGTALRDNIYMTEYVMDMFSYDTIEYTGNSNSKKNGTTYQELKSLTCEGINIQNNLAYGSEVEYILYGGTNAGNVATAYAVIYGIRLAFNLIYAFTSSELRTSALAIATPISAATCGVVPIPLIQYGLLAACAVAESGIDIANLKTGNKVPLYKTQKTWHFQLSNAMSSIVSGTADGIKQIANKTIDTGVEKIGELLDKSEEELLNYSGNIEGQIDLAFNTVFDEQINAVVNELSSLITSSIQNSANDKGDFNVQNSVDYVKTQLKQWNDADDSSGMIKEIRTAAVNYLLSNDDYIESAINAFTKTDIDSTELANMIQYKLSDIKSGLSDQIKEKIDFKKQLGDIKDEINQSIKSGAGKIKDSLNGALDKLNGGTDTSGSGTPTSGTASFFSFDYRDYLKVFLLIKFMTDSNTTLLRMADVIQVNMAKVSNQSEYRLKNSSCYLTLECKTYIKPLFLAVPLVSNTAAVSVNGENGKRTFCFEYDYKRTKGY